MRRIPKITFDDFDEIIIPDRNFFKILCLVVLLISILIALIHPPADQPIWPRILTEEIG